MFLDFWNFTIFFELSIFFFSKNYSTIHRIRVCSVICIYTRVSPQISTKILDKNLKFWTKKKKILDKTLKFWTKIKILDKKNENFGQKKDFHFYSKKR